MRREIPSAKAAWDLFPLLSLIALRIWAFSCDFRQELFAYKKLLREKSDLENNLLYLKGSIPGSKNSTVFLRESVKNVSRKTIKEKHDAKIKAAAAKKGKK